jgi:hypothetical protein
MRTTLTGSLSRMEAALENCLRRRDCKSDQVARWHRARLYRCSNFLTSLSISLFSLSPNIAARYQVHEFWDQRHRFCPTAAVNKLRYRPLLDIECIERRRWKKPSDKKVLQGLWMPRFRVLDLLGFRIGEISARIPPILVVWFDARKGPLFGACSVLRCSPLLWYLLASASFPALYRLLFYLSTTHHHVLCLHVTWQHAPVIKPCKMIIIGIEAGAVSSFRQYSYNGGS